MAWNFFPVMSHCFVSLRFSFVLLSFLSFVFVCGHDFNFCVRFLFIEFCFRGYFLLSLPFWFELLLRLFVRFRFYCHVSPCVVNFVLVLNCVSQSYSVVSFAFIIIYVSFPLSLVFFVVASVLVLTMALGFLSLSFLFASFALLL